MCAKYAISQTRRQEVKKKSQHVASLLETYLDPLLTPLDAYVDKRLVHTFLQMIRTLIEARNQAPGLTISELGSTLLSGRQATASEKKIHRLLSSEKWDEKV